MGWLRRVPLAGQFFFAVVLGTLLIALVVVFIARFSVDRSLRSVLVDESRMTASTIASASMDAMIVQDRPILQTIADQVIVRDLRIQSIVIENAAGVILASAEGPAGGEGDLVISEELVYHGDSYGRINFAWSTSQFDDVIEGTSMQIAYWTAVVLLVTFAFLFLGIHRLVLHPLFTLHRYLMSVQEEREPEPFPAQKSPEFIFLAAEAELVAQAIATEKMMREEATRTSRRVELLLKELDHRVKNNLASIISLVRRGGETAETPGALSADLVTHIMAIARSQEAMSKAGWKGLDLKRDLPFILDPTSHGVIPDRISISGPSVVLPNNQATPLCLALAELLVNAVKHGSLHGEVGRISLEWSVVEGRLELRWIETGGTEPVNPPVLPPPSDSGLGQSLLKGLVEYELGGSLQIDFEQSGLKALISIPLEE